MLSIMTSSRERCASAPRAAREILLVVLVFCSFGAARRVAQPPAPAPTPWLAEFPNVDRVVADVKGTDDTDTAARLGSTLNHLEGIVSLLTGGAAHAPISQAELDLQKAYREKKEDVGLRTNLRLRADEKAADRARYIASVERYDHDPAFFQALVEHYFSPAWRSAYGSLLAERKAAHDLAEKQRLAAIEASAETRKANTPRTAAEKHAEDRRAGIIFAVVSAASLATAAVLAVWIGRRRFNRRATSGGEVFPNAPVAMGNLALESAVWNFVIIPLMLVFIATMVLAWFQFMK